MDEKVKELAEKIAEEKGTDVDEVIDKIEGKEEEYSGLISKEGAAHIVAKEEGLELMEEEGDNELKIENVVSGMNSATVTGKVEKIFGPRTFETDDGEGKVANLILRDGTGTVRFSLWNDEAEELIEDEKIEVGDTIKVENGYVTEDNRDEPELRLGRSGKVKEPEEELDVEIQTGSGGSSGESQGRVKISELVPGQSGEARGTVVNTFGKNPFYKTCPECEERVEDEECEEHGKVKINMALSLVIDDGSGSIRCVFFRDQAEELLDMDTDEAWKMTDEGENMEEFMERCDELLGNEIVVQGRVKMNDFFGMPELLVNSMEKADVAEEAEKLLETV
ncbi:MAG: OB-fold nucleic acid binding domain-containing protein [Candidatus Aenigmatarchaeota archaeon]